MAKTKFEKVMGDVVDRLTKIEDTFKAKPPKPKEGEAEELKLLRENYDTKFDTLEKDFGGLKKIFTDAKTSVESGSGSFMDFLFKP